MPAGGVVINHQVPPSLSMTLFAGHHFVSVARSVSIHLHRDGQAVTRWWRVGLMAIKSHSLSLVPEPSSHPHVDSGGRSWVPQRVLGQSTSPDVFRHTCQLSRQRGKRIRTVRGNFPCGGSRVCNESDSAVGEAIPFPRERHRCYRGVRIPRHCSVVSTASLRFCASSARVR